MIYLLGLAMVALVVALFVMTSILGGLLRAQAEKHNLFVSGERAEFIKERRLYLQQLENNQVLWMDRIGVLENKVLSLVPAPPIQTVGGNLIAGEQNMQLHLAEMQQESKDVPMDEVVQKILDDDTDDDETKARKMNQYIDASMGANR